MGDFIFLFVVIVIIGSVVGKIKNAAKNQQQNRQYGQGNIEEHNRRLAEAAQMRSQQDRQRNTPYPAPHVAPHPPTFHTQTDSYDCDAHRRPVSTEGSPYRVHLHSATDTNCNVHTEPVSTEGESKEVRLQRLQRQKDERAAHDAFLNRYDAIDKKNEKEAHIRQPQYSHTKIKVNGNSVLQGIVFNEILNPPVSKRHKCTH